MKGNLVGANAKRVRAVETGDLTVVGVNRWTETAVSPLSAGEGTIEVVDPGLEVQVRSRLADWKKARDSGGSLGRACGASDAAARSGANIMPPSIRCAKAGVTTGEWADTLRAVFGDYRGPTGVGLVLVEADGDDTTGRQGAGEERRRNGLGAR